MASVFSATCFLGSGRRTEEPQEIQRQTGFRSLGGVPSDKSSLSHKASQDEGIERGISRR